MADVFPKFIIEDGNLIFQKCTYHYEIVIDKSKVKGGGWWRYKDGMWILYGDSHDFGKASLEDIKVCIANGNVFTDKYLLHNISNTKKLAYDTGTEIILLNQ